MNARLWQERLAAYGVAATLGLALPALGGVGAGFWLGKVPGLLAYFFLLWMAMILVAAWYARRTRLLVKADG